MSKQRRVVQIRSLVWFTPSPALDIVTICMVLDALVSLNYMPPMHGIHISDLASTCEVTHGESGRTWVNLSLRVYDVHASFRTLQSL